jgi:hypothetical protein
MPFPDKPTVTTDGLSASGYASQAVEAMRVIHNSFVIMKGKLEDALGKKQVTDKQYRDWLRCFDMLQVDWLGREVKTAEDVLFLQYMAQNSMEEARRFKVMKKVDS